MQNQNNFDFLRLLFATLVIFSHSFPLTAQEEIVAILTNGQIGLGHLSVSIFFIMSGYLIFISLKNSYSILDYFWKRCLRLFPALFVMLFITLVVAVMVHKGGNIFAQRDFYTYLPSNMLLFNVHYVINGVFVDNPYPQTINGSLWSLCYEFIMYVLVGLFFPFRNNRKIILAILIGIVILSAGATLFNPHILEVQFEKLNIGTIELYRLTASFFSGALLSQLKLRFNRPLIWIIALSVLIISILLGVFPEVSIIVLPVFIISFGLSFFKLLSVVPRAIGDISYGVYIYGFLVQQTLMNYFDLSPYVLTLFSMLITYLFAYFSWHVVEKPALQFKKVFSGASLKLAKGLSE